MKQFELNFRGSSEDGVNYDSGLIINGELDIIGRLFAEYAYEAARRGQPEPMRILIAAFDAMQRKNPDNQSRIIKPKFKN
jgi:hypothetical protein